MRLGKDPSTRSDEHEAVRFLLIKAAIFVLLPLAVAVVVAYFSLSK